VLFEQSLHVVLLAAPERLSWTCTDINIDRVDVNLDSIHQCEISMAWMTAAEALSVLNVRAQTLYANVSRGKIRAKPDETDPRRSLYHRDDVVRMAERRSGQRKVEKVAAQAIDWGDPVLLSAISTVSNGKLWYRGRDAIELANTVSFEAVTELLWETDSVCIEPSIKPSITRTNVEADDPLTASLVALARRSARDLPSSGRTPAVLRDEAASVLSTLAHAVLGGRAFASKGRTLSERLAVSWRCNEAGDAIRRSLVLLADHELNASTFATRVTVSTGASLSAGVLAGLATLTGPLHGGASSSVRGLIETATRVGPEAAVRNWLAQGRVFPAFGHPLYADGDPRARALLSMVNVPPLYAELAASVLTWISRWRFLPLLSICRRMHRCRSSRLPAVLAGSPTRWSKRKQAA
jgi:citrate synthase